MVERNPEVRLASTITGWFVIIVALVIFFAREEIWILAPIAASLGFMGIMLGYFARR